MIDSRLTKLKSPGQIEPVVNRPAVVKIQVEQYSHLATEFHYIFASWVTIKVRRDYLPGKSVLF